MKELKRYQKALILAITFISVFALTFTVLYFYDDFPTLNGTAGKKLNYNGYVETIDGTYLGELYGDSFNGTGQFDFLSGEIYTGSWKDSAMSGSGKMTFKGIGTYDGTYIDSKRVGKGTFVWENGDKYDGEWADDKINGDGTYTFANGNYVKGSFEKNKVSNGTYHISTENYICDIPISDGVLASTIKISFASGESYEGGVSNGMINGNGAIKYRDGATYNGEFKDNRKAGIGTYTWASGECYEGAWENDTMVGKGVYYYKSKGQAPKIEGTFLNGKPDGECKYYETSSITYNTTWKNGKCIKVAEG